MTEFNDPIPFEFEPIPFEHEPIEWGIEPFEFDFEYFTFGGFKPLDFDVLPLWEHQPTME